MRERGVVKSVNDDLLLEFVPYGHVLENVGLGVSMRTGRRLHEGG